MENQIVIKLSFYAVYQGIFGYYTELFYIYISWAGYVPQRMQFMKILSCNGCDWVGWKEDSVHPKHDDSNLLCPECYETTEVVTADWFREVRDEGVRLLGVVEKLEAAQQGVQSDLLPCGHHKDALVENAGRQWCVEANHQYRKRLEELESPPTTACKTDETEKNIKMSEKKVGIEEIRQAIADYMCSEGCSCCRDIRAHEINEKRIAELLEVPKYDDGSGYDFTLFCSQ